MLAAIYSAVENLGVQMACLFTGGVFLCQLENPRLEVELWFISSS
jgi:hypothetical protein